MSQTDADPNQSLLETLTLRKITKQRGLDNFETADLEGSGEICREWITKISEFLLTDVLTIEGELVRQVTPNFLQTLNLDLIQFIKVFEKRQENKYRDFVKSLITCRNSLLVALYALNKAAITQDVKIELDYVKGWITALSECRVDLEKAQEHLNDPESVTASTETGRESKPHSDLSSSPYTEQRSPPSPEAQPIVGQELSSSPNYGNVSLSKLRAAIIDVYKTRDKFSLGIADFGDWLEENNKQKIKDMPVISPSKEPLEATIVQEVIEHLRNKERYKDFLEWFTSEYPGKNNELLGRQT